MSRFHESTVGFANTAADVAADMRELAASLKDPGVLIKYDAD